MKLRGKYKTYEGARKRCELENAIAKGEFERGDKARIYHYTIEQEAEYGTNQPVWRVARYSR